MESYGGIFWGLVEGNNYWNDSVNIKSSRLTKCPTPNVVEDRKKKKP